MIIIAKQSWKASRPRSTAIRMKTSFGKIISGGVLMQQREVATAIAVWVLQLATDFADRLSLPRHLDRGQSPARMSRNAPVGSAFVQIVVAIGVARSAMIASDPGPVRTSLSCRLM